MSNKLFATKPMSQLMSEAQGESHGLKRTLTRLNLTTLGVGAIIGAGIFVLTGQAAAMYAGPAIVISFMISGLACAFAGLCYAEFASMIPIAGSAYTYGYATLGEFFAWIIGWDLILEYLFAASTVSVGWSGYMVSFLKDFNIIIPPEFIAATGTKLYDIPNMGWTALASLPKETIATMNLASIPHVTAIMNLPAMFIIGALVVLLVIGIRESANFNNIMVIVKVSVIILFICLGIMFIKAGNWHPFIPKNTGTWGHFGWSGILRGAGVIFFAYIGFDAVSTAAQESKNPQKDMPWGILGSLTDFYHFIHSCCHCSYRYSKLYHAQCSRSGGSRRKCYGKWHVLVTSNHKNSCHCRIEFCDSGDADGPAKDFLFHVERRFAASCFFACSSQI